MEQTIETAGKDFTGLCFVNLVDFDALWGHRRNPEGYGKEIEKFDVNLGKLLEQLKDDDLLPDHGRPRQRPDLYRNGPHQRTGAAPCVLTVYEGERPSGDEGHLCRDRRIRCRKLRRKMPEGTIGTSILESWK